MCHEWLKPPIWPEDLPMFRELLRFRVGPYQSVGSANTSALPIAS